MYAKYSSTDEHQTKPSLKNISTSLLKNKTVCAGFPKLVKLAKLSLVMPVTTARVERSFSDMKATKTRLRNRLGERTLDQVLRVCIEGPKTLSESDIELIIDHWAAQRPRRIAV